ncbi:DoxX family protein [Blastococcus sp. SYSU D00922]
MDVVLWILAGLLALAFLGAGLTKLVRPKDELATTMGWVEDFPPGVIKLIGALEVLAAIGLVLPAALDVVPVLVPLAAVGLVALMLGAAITHARRKETAMIAVNAVLLVLALVVAWGRFGPWSFTA